MGKAVQGHTWLGGVHVRPKLQVEWARDGEGTMAKALVTNDIRLHPLCLDPVPLPAFAQVVMLYVDEETSIERQLERAKLASAHNKRVLDAGAGQLWWVQLGNGGMDGWAEGDGICVASTAKGRAGWSGGACLEQGMVVP